MPVYIPRLLWSLTTPFMKTTLTTPFMKTTLQLQAPRAHLAALTHLAKLFSIWELVTFWTLRESMTERNSSCKSFLTSISSRSCERSLTLHPISKQQGLALLKALQTWSLLCWDTRGSMRHTNRHGHILYWTRKRRQPLVATRSTQKNSRLTQKGSGSLLAPRAVHWLAKSRPLPGYPWIEWNSKPHHLCLGFQQLSCHVKQSVCMVCCISFGEKWFKNTRDQNDMLSVPLLVSMYRQQSYNQI